MLSCGACMLYSFFLQPKKLAERLDLPYVGIIFTDRLSKLCETISKKPTPGYVTALILETCVNDKDGEDVEVPYIRVVIKA